MGSKLTAVVGPTVEQIQRFLEIYKDLERFEATHRAYRGWGLLNEKDLPIPECIAVTEWLQQLVAPDDKIIVDGGVNDSKFAEESWVPYRGGAVSDGQIYTDASRSQRENLEGFVDDE